MLCIHFTLVLEQDQILKIWFAKQDVQNQFVAIHEQKRPLDSLRDQTAKLKTKLETYQKLLLKYSTTSPHPSQPTNITYTKLLETDFDHLFWNDGLFTDRREPWAINANTQHGMRQIAYYDQAKEEIRRLGWEARRVMRWDIDSHRLLSTYLYQLQTHILVEDAQPIDLPLINHPALSLLSGLGKISAARMIINQKLVRIFNLQADWNTGLREILHCTPSQEGDNELKISWYNQIQKIQNMYVKKMLSLNTGFVTILEGVEDVIQTDNQANNNIQIDSEGITNTDGDSSDDLSVEDIDLEWEDVHEAMM
ncbi:uncharacterized protein MELLADRAFT_62062 [Melampsora larici-populina 98AG31]|uniref:Uncharacterized protein n=1 Tax=Melampsora larici-populina (strain 98AG31 / pathotype 3-4-7) TaxID=747676 RepID=F4RH97_MELLP|nr:uncharacterized protein MELLADRAFT_62062 [Melampsora larici-populina 98AG31]EGG08292.1 hypothetical protein MELLADRAFT_62062 [Melampsora larici-populina 98AG31]